MLLLPSILGAVVFFGYPLAQTFWLSFTHYDLLSAPRWAGLANYRYMGQDATFWPAVRNTGWLLAVLVPLRVVLSFSIALLITGVRHTRGLLRVIFYLPSLVPPVAAALAFVYLLNPGTGPVAPLLRRIGLPAPMWFESPGWSKPALVLLTLWGIGTFIIIFYAALLDVPVELYEAASIDGAGPWRRLWNVTVPSLRPVLLFAMITAVIDALQYFTQAYVVAQVLSGGTTTTAGVLGYPQNSTLFYPVLLYRQGFQNFNMGYASALAVLLFLVSLAVAAVFVRRTRSWLQVAGR